MLGIVVGQSGQPGSTDGAFIHGVPAGSPSRDGDVTVYALDINQPSLLTVFSLYSVLISVSVFMDFSTVFYSTKFYRQLSVFSPCSSGFILPDWSFQLYIFFMKVSLSPTN